MIRLEITSLMVIEAMVGVVVEENVISEEVVVMIVVSEEVVVAMGDDMEVEELPVRTKLITWTMTRVKMIIGYSKMKITIIVITIILILILLIIVIIIILILILLQNVIICILLRV